MNQNTIGVVYDQAHRYPTPTALGAPIAYFFAADDETEFTCLEAGNDH